MNATRCAPTTSAFFFGVASLTLAISGCKNAETGPTGPPAPPRSGPVPSIGGTWTGTMKSGDRSTRPVTVAIEQPAGGRIGHRKNQDNELLQWMPGMGVVSPH